MRRKICLLVFILFFTFSSFAFPSDNPKENLTIGWLFDSNIKEKLAVPRHMWLKNGKALLLDMRQDRNDRTLELFDPQTGERNPAIDKDKILSILKKINSDKAPSFIKWPAAVDPNGKAIVFVIGEDLFCVELSRSHVIQITQSPSIEKSITFSPDGKWVSFIRDNDIYAVEWRKIKEKRLTTGATDKLLNGPLSWVYWEEIYDHTSVPYSWSPDSTAIAYLQTDDSPVSISTFVNFKPATQGVIRQCYPKAGQDNPKVRLGIVELSSAETTWIDCGFYEYIARFNWLPDSKRIAVQTLNRQQSELRLMFAERKTGDSQEILFEKQPCWINLNDSLYFLEKEEKFIWLSEQDGYQHLYLYDLNGELVSQVTKGDFMVIPSAGALVSRNGGLAAVDEEQGWVYFTSNKKDLKERHLYRIKMDGSGLERLSSGKGLHAVSFSTDGKYYFDTYSSSSKPPELALYKADGTGIVTITPAALELLENFNLYFPEFHTFETDDGLELPATMTKPANFNPEKKYPVIVYVYGGPGSQQIVDRWSNRWLWHSLLAQEGFFVFVFEVRTGMGKDKTIETSVYRRAYGEQNLKDILAGVDWLKKMSFIDQNQLGVWGWSGGGCTTLYTMTHSDIFKAAIAVAPVADWHFYDTIYTERYQGTPQDNPEGYKETSSVLAAKNLKGHLLIVHGTYDDNVHPQNTFAFTNSLIKNNIKFELMIYPWRKHGVSDTPARIHLYNLMLDFWNRNLK